MKILVINNNTLHMENLMDNLHGHEVETVHYTPGTKLNHHDKDLILLSGGGGEGLEIHDKYRRGKLWYDDQMKFVKDCDKPLIGICMGFEVIAQAFGAPVKRKKDGLTHGYFKIDTTPAGRRLLDKDQLLQYKAHSWHVPEPPKDFEVLATSPDGIEIIKHKTRPIIATQFHPEKGGTLNLGQLLAI